MIDKIIDLKKQYVPAKFALDHLVDYARKGGGTVAGAHKVLWDFLECVATLTAAQPAGPTVHIENCDFNGKNKDGSDVFIHHIRPDGLMEIAEIRMVGWNCHGPAPSQPAALPRPYQVTDGDAFELLDSLASALDSSFISSWQTTAGWSKELAAALDFIAARKAAEGSKT